DFLKYGHFLNGPEWVPQHLCSGSWKSLWCGGPGWTSRTAADLHSVGVVKLRNIVDAAGPALHNTEAVASLLGLKSARHTRTILNEWIQRLSDNEMEMLREYSNRKETPDEGDPFPDIGILADQDGLEPRTHADFQMQNGRGFYRLCPLALNKQK
ncbi:hypothetical protein JOQ06_029949, partial [Pogonophryne albipinna]